MTIITSKKLDFSKKKIFNFPLENKKTLCVQNENKFTSMPIDLKNLDIGKASQKILVL